MPRHPPNTLETLDRSHLQRPTPEDTSSPAAAPKTGPRQHFVTQSARPNDPAVRYRRSTPYDEYAEPSPGPGSPGHHALHHVQQPARGNPARMPRPDNSQAGQSLFPRSSRRTGGAAAWVMVGQGRLELPTSRLSSARSNQLSYWPTNRTSAHHRPSLPLPLGNGGGGRVRTDDLRLAKPSLSQLSYAPMRQPAASLSGAASRGLDREGMRRRRSRGHSPVRDRDDCFQPDP